MVKIKSKIISLVCTAFFSVILCTQSNASTFTDWSTDVLSENAGLYAATVNDSGVILGEYCYYGSKSCYWYIGVDFSCEAGASYLVLANTDTGAQSLKLICDANMGNGVYRLAFNWQEVEGILKDSQRIGFAVPTKSGQFIVYRFSLKGMAAATHELESVFFPLVQNQNSTNSLNTKTSVL